jgi:predicted glycosyltransferase
MSFMPFRVKTVIFGQNRVHPINTGPTMPTGVKNKFQAISGQNRVHPINTGPTMPTGIKNEFQAILGQNCYF